MDKKHQENQESKAYIYKSFILEYDSHLKLWQLAKNKKVYLENSIVNYLQNEALLKGLIKEEPGKLTVECDLIVNLDKKQWEINLKPPVTFVAKPIGLTSGNVECNREGMIILIP